MPGGARGGKPHGIRDQLRHPKQHESPPIAAKKKVSFRKVGNSEMFRRRAAADVVIDSIPAGNQATKITI